MLALAPTGYNESELAVGGSFTHSGSTAVTNVARWSGSSWSAYGLGCGATVRSLATFGGALIAGGDFVKSMNGGIDRDTNRIAKWSGTGWAMLEPNDQGTDKPVHVLLPQSGFLWIGGEFTKTDGQHANHGIARYFLNSARGGSTHAALGASSGNAPPSIEWTSMPAPYRPGSPIVFATVAPGRVKVSVHDVSGRLVSELTSGELSAGTHSTAWMGQDRSGARAPAGLYFVRISGASGVTSRKLVLVR